MEKWFNSSLSHSEDRRFEPGWKHSFFCYFSHLSETFKSFCAVVVSRDIVFGVDLNKCIERIYMR